MRTVRVKAFTIFDLVHTQNAYYDIFSLLWYNMEHYTMVRSSSALTLLWYKFIDRRALIVKMERKYVFFVVKSNFQHLKSHLSDNALCWRLFSAGTYSLTINNCFQVDKTASLLFWLKKNITYTYTNTFEVNELYRDVSRGCSVGNDSWSMFYIQQSQGFWPQSKVYVSKFNARHLQH